jgi:hypothetical protein
MKSVQTGALLLCTLLLTAAAFGAGNAGAAGVHCPVGALVLPARGMTQAAKAALAAAASSYRGLNTKDAKVVSAKRATVAGPRGVEVGRECGLKARARTVVVELRFPRMLPSASLSEGIVDVARFAQGYRVWAVVH